MKTQRELLSQLRKMEIEMLKAYEIMDKMEDVNEIISERYPFNKSFDELTMEVGEWIENIEDKITEQEDRVLRLIESIGYGLGVDLEGQESVTYDMIYLFYLDSNHKATKQEIRAAVIEWINETKMNHPEIFEDYKI